MTKEISPLSEKNVYKLDRMFNFMTNGDYEFFLNMILKNFKPLTEGEVEDEGVKLEKESLKELVGKLTAEIDGMKTLQKDDGDIIFMTQAGDKIYIDEWERKLTEIQKALNPTPKRVRKPKATAVIPKIEEVVDLISKKPKKVKKSLSKIIPKKEAESKEEKEEEKEEEKPVSKNKTDKVVIKDLSDLPNQENEPVSSYDELIHNLIKNKEFKNDFLMNRRKKIEELKKQLSKNPNKEEVESVKNKHINSIKSLVLKIREYGLEGGGTILDHLQNDMREIANIGVENKPTQTAEEKPEVDKKKVEAILSYKSIRDEILEYKEELEKNSDKKTKTKVRHFIKKQKRKIQDLVNYITVNGIKSDEKKGGDYIAELRQDQELLRKLERLLNGEKDITIEKTTGNENDTVPSKTAKFEKLNLWTQLSNQDVAILKSNPELYNNVLSSIEEYNNLIENNAPISEIQKANKWVQKNRTEWLSYKDWFMNEREVLHTKNKKVQGKIDIGDGDDEMSVQRHIERSKTKTLQTSRDIPPMPIEGMVAESEPEKVIETEEGHDDAIDITVPLDKIFTIDTSEDYSEILENPDFNNWLAGIYSSLKKEGRNNMYEVKDIKEWYKKYTEIIPYYKKLSEIINNPANTNNEIKSLMLQSRVNDFMYDLYKNKLGTKEKIDTIYVLYQDIEQNKKDVERLKNLAKIKTDVEESRRGKTYDTQLKSDQVQRILESRGDENLEENLNEFTNFLSNIHLNYEFYSSGIKDELESENINLIVTRLTGNKYDIRKPKIGRVKGFFKKINPMNIFKEAKIEDLNTYSPLITEIRKQNLVDRKDGNESRSRDNQMRMRKLLEFISSGGKRGFIKRYLENPRSESIEREMEAFDEDDKKIFNIFISTYNVFTTQKYRSEEARKKAEDMLKTDSTITLSEVDESSMTSEVFSFDTKDELRKLEKRSVYEDAVKRLGHLEQQVNSFTTERRDIETVKNMSNNFTEIKNTLESADTFTDQDTLLLKKVEMKLSELIIRHINKNDFKELTSSLKNYDTILESNSVENTKKEEYLNALISSLKLQRRNPDNGILQNAILDNIITDYTQKLNSLS